MCSNNFVFKVWIFLSSTVRRRQQHGKFRCRNHPKSSQLLKFVQVGINGRLAGAVSGHSFITCQDRKGMRREYGGGGGVGVQGVGKRREREVEGRRQWDGCDVLLCCLLCSHSLTLSRRVPSSASGAASASPPACALGSSESGSWGRVHPAPPEWQAATLLPFPPPSLACVLPGCLGWPLEKGWLCQPTWKNYHLRQQTQAR